MANSLGTLTLDLIAKVGAFTGPLDRASQEAKKRNAEIAKSFDSLAKGVGVAIGSIPAVLTAMVVSSAGAAKEISNQAALAGLGTTEFQKYAAGARTVGVEQDKLSDIFKDVNDKVGDFLSTGGGELKDFFTNIAPKVGVTADQFKKLNSKEALALYVTSLEKANVNQQEMTFYMEAIANDSTSLVPLLRNGGKAFDELGQAALDAGVVMDESTIAAAKQFGIELSGLGQYLTSAKTMLAAEFLPVLAQFSKDVNQSAKDAGGLKGQVGDLGEKLVTAAAFVANAGDGVARVFDIVANTLVGMYATAVGHMSSLMADLAMGMSKITIGDTAKQFVADSARLRDEASTNFNIAAQAAASIGDNLDKPLAGDKFKEYVVNAKKAAEELAKTNLSVTPGTGSGVDPDAIAAAAAAAKKAASDAAAAAKKIQESFSSTETDLQRQIELINTTTDKRKDATEVAKLQFEFESGKLAGLSDQHKERLKGLAEELDKRKELKQANEDAAKLAAFGANLKDSNQTIKQGYEIELAGAGSGDKLKERLKADLEIQQEHDRQVADLFAQRNAGDISQELYDKETEMLGEALAERMVIQQDYYNQQDEAQSNWMAGVGDAWNNYVDQARDISGQTKDMFTSAFSGMNDALYNFVTTGKLSFSSLAATFAETALRMLIQWGTAQVAMAALNAFTSTAAIPIVGPLAAPAAAASALGSAGSFMSVISSVAGMAHDGIDSVPEDGTWLLQKGERVTTAETSAKLDRTLDSIGSNKGPTSFGNTTVNLIEDASRAGQQRTRLSDDQTQQVVDVWISKLYSDDDVSEALSRKFGLQGVGG